MKKSFVFSLKALLAGLLLYLVWRAGYIDLQSLTGLFASEKLIVILLFVLISSLLVGVRLYYLVRPFSQQVSVRHAVQLTFVGNFFNYCLPGGTGGDIIKSLMLAQKASVPRWNAVGIVLMDRILGLFSICSISLFAMLTHFEVTSRHPIARVVFLIIASIVGLSLLFYYLLVYQQNFLIKPNKISGYFKRSEFLNIMRKGLRIKDLLWPLALTLISHLIIIYSMYYTAIAIDEAPQYLGLYMLVVPVGLTLGSLPITPAGIGVAQVAFFTIFKIYTGIESDTPATTVSVYQITMFLISLSGLYYYLFGGYKILRQNND